MAWEWGHHKRLSLFNVFNKIWLLCFVSIMRRSVSTSLLHWSEHQYPCSHYNLCCSICFRPFFTYFITTLHILITVLSVAVHGISPIGFREAKSNTTVSTTNVHSHTHCVKHLLKVVSSPRGKFKERSEVEGL